MSTLEQKNYWPWMPLVFRTARAIAIGVLALGASSLLAGIILWDADFYAARDRWEHFKNAWFGQWPENNKLRLLRNEDMVVCHWGNNGTIGLCFLKKENSPKTEGETDDD